MAEDIEPITGTGAKVAARLCNFETNTATLLHSHIKFLDEEVAPVIRQLQGPWVNMWGYASRRGDDKKNMLLSEQRIDAVKRHIAGYARDVNFQIQTPLGETTSGSDETDNSGQWRAVAVHVFAFKPPPPAEEDTAAKRIERALKLLEVRGLSLPVRTRRASCILRKMRQPGVQDIFVDGRRTNETINKHKVTWWVCSWAGNYDPPELSPLELSKFFGSVGVILRGPGFAPEKSDDEILRLLEEILTRIVHGIVRVDRYITMQSMEFGYAGDRTRPKLKNLIAKELNNDNNIYSCFRDYRGGEFDPTDSRGFPRSSPTPAGDPQHAY
jgi:hypothetical protein